MACQRSSLLVFPFAEYEAQLHGEGLVERFPADYMMDVAPTDKEAPVECASAPTPKEKRLKS